MKTTRTKSGNWRGHFAWQVMLLQLLFVWMVPQGAQALDTVILDNKTFYVLRSSSDWDTFCQKVADAKAGYDVNAIMAADFSVSSQSCGSEGLEFRGIFDGNGHTLNATWTSESAYQSTFRWVKGVTIRNLHVTGSVNGGNLSSGLIGRIVGNPNVYIDRVWVSANVTSNSNHVGGFIGHAHKAKLYINDCRFDGTLTANDASNSYGGSIIGWTDHEAIYRYSSTAFNLHRCYENGTYNSIKHVGFCYLYNNGTYAWGQNAASTLCVSAHDWGEVVSEYRKVTDQTILAAKMNGEKTNSWKEVGGKAVPVGSYPMEDTNFEVYTIVPGTEQGEENMLKIPFSCDKPVSWIGGTYTGEDGTTKTITGTSFDKNTYAGFIMLPGTVQHKDLKLNIMLADGLTILNYEVKSNTDAVMHNPRNLTAQLLTYNTNKKLADAGVVELKWNVKDASVSDVIETDEFLVMRSLTGDINDMETIGTVSFEKDKSDYTYRDETLVSALIAEHVDETSAVLKVRYLVVRASAQQLWGMECAASAQISCTLSGLHLLRVKDFQTAWADQTARTVKVTWQYADEPAAVWDSRAKMNIVVSATNREGNGAGTYLVPLTEADMLAREKVITLDRSCVDYKITLDVERGESAIPVEPSTYFEIRTAEDWNTFCTMVENAGGKSNVNASLMADISVTNMVGTNKPFRGTFEGNGHTLTVNINKNEQCVAPFRYVGKAIIRNLHTAGSVTTNNKFAAGLVSRVSDKNHLLIEGCHVSVDVSSSINGDATNGGIVAIGNNGSTITIQNSKFDGKMLGASCYANGGIVGYTTGEVRIDNTLFDPKEISTNMSSCETWSRKGGSGSVTVTNSYCTKEYKAATPASEFPGYFVINSSADWNTFCNMVEQAQGNSDVNAVLYADITVTQQVGSYSYLYRGTFDGNGHTININLETDDYGAVFRCASNCTIKNLHVTGNINCRNSNSDASGIIANISEGSTADIINCRVSATIKGNYVGGIVGVALSGKITLTNCLFDGNLVGYDSNSRGSAFVGRRYSDAAPPTLNNCLDHGTYQSFASKRLSDNGEVAGSNNWSYNGLTGATAVGSLSASDLAAKLGSGWTVADGNAVPVMQAKTVSGNVAGKSADQIVALLGNGWTKDASGNPVPKMADNKQEKIPYSAKHPFTISSAADWDTFCKMVEEAKGQKDFYVELLADITVETTAGNSDSSPFRGTFNGNGHTLTFNKSGWTERFIAPFRQVGNAIIKNLHTAGSIQSSNMYATGLVGRVVDNSTVTIENCHSSVSLKCTTSGDMTLSGFVGRLERCNLTIRNCKFDGSFEGASSYGHTGFVSWEAPNCNVKIKNCLFAPISISTKLDECETWLRKDGNSSAVYSVTNSYCYTEFNGEEGNAVNMNATALVAALGSQWQVNSIGQVVPKTIGDLIDGMNTFYYENLGHINKKSLKVEQRKTSTVLTWENQTDEPVDYYEIHRYDKQQKKWEIIVTQLTDMQYEDKETSPVHQYIYKVRGVTSCEGLTYDETEEVEGMCEQTGTVEGHLCFLDGTGIPGQEIIVTVDGKERREVTDESGFFRFTGLPYKDGQETSYDLATTIPETAGSVLFGTLPGENVRTGVVIEVKNSVKLSGSVQYEGTSIPVQGVTFKVNGHDVRNAAGKVESDHEGNFSFRILPSSGKGDTIQAVKDNHIFWRNGYYHEKDSDPDTKLGYSFTTDMAGLMFYDQTRVKMIGRIVGGKTQGEKPIGYGLSNNNLGDSIRLVLTLEGDNASRLVFDIQDRNLKERDEVFTHQDAQAVDKKFEHQTKVHTTLNRKVVYPDPHTGEYEVWLQPVKWKIQQITASGYATLFQDGQMGDVIDLTDSLTLHEDEVKGTWKTSGNGVNVVNPLEKYHAKYNRIYHSPVLIEYKQQGFGDLAFYGDRYYAYKNVSGDKQQLTLAYKASDGTTAYTFGYPVFSIGKKYPFWLSATEKYYYNNNTKSDTIDVVHLDGGLVTIHNGLEDPLHRDTVQLDSIGQGTYVMEITQKPYLLTGDDALQTMTMTLLMDGTHYEATPLKGYVFHIQQATGAQDILSYERPILVDVLRDPPGGSSHATLSKGSTLRYAYSMDFAAEAGIEIGGKVGFGLNSTFGIVAAPLGVGGQTSQGLKVEGGIKTAYDMTYSLNGERAFEYTMTAAEDISTSSDPKLVGADGDLYIGTIQNIVVKPALAIRAIPDSVWRVMDGALKAESTIEIARGLDDKGKTLHLVRDEVLTYGPDFKSNFIYSQYYLINQLIPELTQQVYSLMYTGTQAEAKTQANATGEPVYLSLVDKNNPDFGTRYTIIYPDGKGSGDFVDKVERHNASILEWMKMIGQNEEEKLTATNPVANYDVDGGTTVNYSETFQNDYSTMRSVVNPFTPITDTFFEEDDANFFTAIGSLATKLLGFEEGVKLSLKVDGMGGKMEFSITPHASVLVTPHSNTAETYSRTESFTISMDKKSHLSVDVFRVENKTSSATTKDRLDVFIANKFWSQMDTNEDFLDREFETDKMCKPRSFVYRTVGGATCRPWEDQRKSHIYQAGTIIDARTKRIENPKIKIDRQSISGVPYGEPARFKLYITNESEQPEAAYAYFDLYQVDMKNPDGARLMIDGMPLTGTARTIEVRPGVVTEKTLEVYASEKFDYEGLQIGIISQDDVDCYAEVSFDVHFLQTAGPVAITAPGDKWVMNCDAPTDGKKGWYLPVVISGFDKNQHNFDHIEFQYKETTRGDDYWTNLCGYYADSTLYRAANGTKAMIPENGNIMTRFFGEGTVMEKGYDLRAVLFCRNGNAFLTSESEVLSGVKDTRRPQLFGTPEPKSGILGVGENIVFDFSEDIEYNYLQKVTNFEVVGETNENAVQEAPSLQFGGNGYAMTQTRRNFSDKSVTVEMMIKPDDTGREMPLFSHGSEGKRLELWLTADKKLKAVVGERELTSTEAVGSEGFQRVALVLDNDNQRLMLYSSHQIGNWDDVSYSGTGPLTFGAARLDEEGSQYYEGRMLQARVWYRTFDLAGLNTYANRLLTGYEMGLVDYYPMNDGTGTYATDQAQGAHLMLEGASWAQPTGMSLKIVPTVEENPTKQLDISSDEAWNTFVEMVEKAQGQYDVNATLMADITITRPVGTSAAKAYRGNFDGNGHTVTCNIDWGEQDTAPFRFVSNATISNLHTAGLLSSSKKHMGGIIGSITSGSTVTVENCRSSVTLKNSTNDDSCVGGLVGTAMNIKGLTIDNCVFDGAFDGPNNQRNGGFVGWAYNYGQLTIQNCLFAPTSINTGFASCDTWVRRGGSGNLTTTNNHSTKLYETRTFHIKTAADWNSLVEKMRGFGYQENLTIMLDADIDIGENLIDGVFSGTFEGNGHTLTCNLTNTLDCCAPFTYVVDNTTIRNLHMAGTITTQKKNAGGLVGYVKGNCNLIVEGCRVSVNIYSDIHGEGVSGGIVGYGHENSTITLRNCKFDGKLRGDQSYSNGGMVGYSEGQVTIANSLFAPEEINIGTYNSNTWARIGGKGNLTLTESHSIRGVNDYYHTSNGVDYYFKDGKDYCLLRNADDWETFRQLVKENKGSWDSFKYGIMTADFTVTTMLGETKEENFVGGIMGNGHTLTVNIDGGDSAYVAPFRYITYAQISDLHVKGNVKGGIHTSSLIGRVDGTLNVNRVRVSTDITTTSTHLGGFVGHGGSSHFLHVEDCLFDGSLNATGSGQYGGSFIGWETPDKEYSYKDYNGFTLSCYENGTYNNLVHTGFNYYDDGEGHPYAYYNCVTAHDWKEVQEESRRNITDQNQVVQLLPGWQLVDGKAVPVMEVFDLPEQGQENLSNDELLAALGDGWMKDVNGEPVPVTSTIVDILVPGDVDGMSADETASLLGNEWTVDADGYVVPNTKPVDYSQQIKLQGLQLRSELFQRTDEQDYTLMLWFKTAEADGALISNGAGKANDEGAKNKFFLGFEEGTLKYRTNGREFLLGDDLNNDNWHHFALTVNRPRNVATIFIDNQVKAQFTTDSLGGMVGSRFYLGNMVYQELGNPALKQDNAFTGHLDGLILFEQALPATLIKRYSQKSPGGEERGLKVFMPFDHQVEQKSGTLALMPYALSKVVKYDNDGIDTGKRDSVFVNPVAEIESMIDQNMGAPVQAHELLRKLNFSYVGRNNQLLVNIDEQDSRINKRNMYVTLYDIPDKNGNFMESPVTESFYVNRNPLTWMTLGKHRVVTVQQGQPLLLIGIIENNGGKAHTYTLENVPRWITVDKTSDIVQPQATDEVDFTISADLEVGTYDQMIYLTDENGMSDAYFLELTVEGREPNWKVDPSLQHYSMNVVAQVFVGNTLVTDSHDIVAAFDADGRCMGVNNIEYDTSTGQSMLYMTVYDNTTETRQLSFYLWHYATGKTMQLTPSQLIHFSNKAIVGTVDKPVRMTTENMYQQKIDLAQGWNWISFNVYDVSFANLSSVLSRFQWQEGDILTEDTKGLTLVYKKGKWISTMGSAIENLELSQTVSYSILVQGNHQIDLWGTAFMTAAQRTMTVKPGWSSIGYTPLVNLPVTTALTEYFDEATPGDVVKNQHEFAMFTSDGKGGGKWQGTLKYMKPGEGYMIHRQKQTTATFTYPYYEPGENFFETTTHAPQYAGFRFATTMSVVAEAVGIELEEGDKLIAYANGEVVGETSLDPSTLGRRTLATERTQEGGKLLPFGEAGRGLFFLSIGGIEAPSGAVGGVLSFAIERGGDIIATTGEVMNYQVNGISGTVDKPTQISFVKTDQLPQTGWYTVNGIKLQKAPTQSGVYIYNGKKQVIK